MTTLIVKDQDQGQGIAELVRWFDYESSSLHHALIMAAERNEADALDAEVQQFPPVVATLTESAQRWRAIAARVLELAEKVGDPDDVFHSY
jgi:hypothetical protein